MITLYTKPACSACVRVKDRMHELALPYEEKSIAEDEHLAELLLKGGKRQVPYMVDDDRGISMYQSADILQYLETRK